MAEKCGEVIYSNCFTAVRTPNQLRQTQAKVSQINVFGYFTSLYPTGQVTVLVKVKPHGGKMLTVPFLWASDTRFLLAMSRKY